LPRKAKDNASGVKDLALYVLRAAAFDIQSGGREEERCIKEIRAGGIDLYLGLLETEMTAEEFISFSKKGGKKNVQMS
jgi:hypothetical protein